MTGRCGYCSNASISHQFRTSRSTSEDAEDRPVEKLPYGSNVDVGQSELTTPCKMDIRRSWTGRRRSAMILKPCAISSISFVSICSNAQSLLFLFFRIIVGCVGVDVGGGPCIFISEVCCCCWWWCWWLGWSPTEEAEIGVAVVVADVKLDPQWTQWTQWIWVGVWSLAGDAAPIVESLSIPMQLPLVSSSVVDILSVTNNWPTLRN